MRHFRFLHPGSLCLLGLLGLAACNGPSARDAEIAALRERVERLERETAEERTRLAEDVASLRASLDEADRHMAELSAAGGQNGAAPQNATAAKSPRAALRENLREVMELSRQALDRLNQSLEKSLARAKRPAAPEAPEK